MMRLAQQIKKQYNVQNNLNFKWMSAQQINEDLKQRLAQAQQNEKDQEFLLADLEVRYNQALEDKAKLSLEINQRTDIHQKTLNNIKRESESLRYALHTRSNELEQMRTYKEYYQHAKDEAQQLREQLKAQFELSQRLREENEYLEGQLIEFRKDYQVVQDGADKTFSELEEVRAELESRQRQVQDADYYRQEFQSLSEKHQQEIDMRDAQLQHYDHQMREAQDLILNLEQSNLSLQNQVQRLQQKRKPSEENNRGRMKELEKLLINKEQELGDLYSALEDLKMFTSQLKRQVDASEATQLTLRQDFQAQQNQFTAQRSKLMEEVYHLHQQIQFHEKDKSSLTQEVEALRRMNMETKAANDEQKLKIDKLIEHNENIQRQNLEILSKIDENYKDNRMLRELINQKDEQLDSMISENAILSQETKEKEDQLQQLFKEKNDLLYRIGAMDKEIADLLSKYQRLEAMLKQLEEERSLRIRLQNQSELLSQEAERKEQQIKDLELKNEEYQDKLTLIEEEFEKCQSEMRGLRRQLNSKSQIFNTNEKLQQSLVLKEREVSHLQGVNDRLDQVNKQLQGECDKLALRLQQLQGENNQLRSSREPKEPFNRDRERESMSFHQGPSQSKLFMEGQTIRDYLERRKIDRPGQTLASRLQSSFNQPSQNINSSRRTSVKK